MAQFAVHRNLNLATGKSTPLLLDVQSELLADLGTRVVVPLRTIASMQGKVIKVLMPILEVEGTQYVMLTPQLAGIANRYVGVEIANVASYRTEIVAALDLLVTGI